MITLYALDSTSYQSDIAHVPKSQFVSETEYWEKYYHYPDITYEWNNGYLEAKAVSDVLTILMYKWFFKLLEYYLETHPIAESVPLEMGFRLPLFYTTKIRRPDLGIVLKSNSMPLLLEDRSYKGIYDICIEALSDSTPEDITRDTEDKKIEYAQAGVQEYYILDGHNRDTQFYCRNANGIYQPIKPINGEIIQSTVLPGFQFRLADLSTPPSPDDMIDDPIYQDFVLPGYRKEKQAHLQEKQARLMAEKQVQQLIKKLRSLGIEPNDI